MDPEAEARKRASREWNSAVKLGLTIELWHELQVELTRRKYAKGQRFILSEAEVTDAFRVLRQGSPVIVRQYRQAAHDGAVKRFNEEAQIFAAHSFVPTSQSFQRMGLVTGGFLNVSYAKQK